MQETLDETNFVIQAALQIVQGNSHDVKGENEESGIKAMPSYLSRSRALEMTASAMWSGLIFNCPEAMAARSSWTRSMLMSLPLFCRFERCRAAELRSTGRQRVVLGKSV